MFLVISAIAAGFGMYYLQVHAFYEEIQATAVEDVQLTSLNTGLPEPILYENFKGIDADSSPLRYRACFETSMSLALLTETYEIYETPVPNNAPGWFDCFDASAVGGALENGSAFGFMGTFNIEYGFDRVVAITDDGRGFVWHQINACGQASFDGDPLPAGCPPPPKAGQ
jgi:hypothetical protein